jgi:ABC-type glycerol-3-phosphate transport system substrate-binding protein
MKRMAGLIAALALAVIAAGCGNGGEDSKTTPIAVVGPITGQ